MQRVALLVCVAVGAVGVLVVSPPLKAGLALPGGQTSSVCTPLVSTQMVRESACGPIDVEHEVRVACRKPGIHVVFVKPYYVRQGSGRYVRDVATGILDTLTAMPGVDVSAGVVQLVHGADLPLGSDLEVVRRNLGDVAEIAGGFAYLPSTKPVEDAIEMVEEAREGSTEIIVVFGEHKPAPSRPYFAIYRQAGQHLQKSGIFTAVACSVRPSIAAGCQLVRELTPKNGAYAENPDERSLVRAVVRYVEDAESAVAAENAWIRAAFPSALAPTDIQPEPDWRSNEGGLNLGWEWGSPAEAVTVTYRLQPEAVGNSNVRLTAGLTDTLGAVSVVSDTLSVVQGDECLVPTATPSPSPTMDPPKPTATPRPRPLYLPVVLNERPCSQVLPFDMALVLDTSSSMLEETPTKLSRATTAITSFVGGLKLGDQAALVTFDSEGRLVQQLTTDRELMRAALTKVTAGVTTRIDLGIEVAQGELIGARSRREARKVMVVLTDGRPNPVAPDEVLEQAKSAKERGVTLFTIGLGGDVDHSLLRETASAPSLYYVAPTAADLERIYAGLVAHIPCDPSRYWGKR